MLEGVCDVVTAPVGVADRVCVEDTDNTRELEGVPDLDIVGVAELLAVVIPDFVRLEVTVFVTDADAVCVVVAVLLGVPVRVTVGV